MKVYVVQGVYYDADEVDPIFGVFTTLEAAKASYPAPPYEGEATAPGTHLDPDGHWVVWDTGYWSANAPYPFLCVQIAECEVHE